ncbi:matrix Gla protein isoform X2 [Dendropsophus ebraccatus]|uniref:matrix Gla protein isoform X2 n=1 Tax=Dendropsophus ebraccatus TaxID=150705 RepID=UPI003831DE27
MIFIVGRKTLRGLEVDSQDKYPSYPGISSTDPAKSKSTSTRLKSCLQETGPGYKNFPVGIREEIKRTRQVSMKSLALLLVVALAIAVTLAYDSVESHESYERYDPFVNSRNANSFMPSQQRNIRMHERIRERAKSTRERQRETCEDYNPCERYAMRYGWAAAYKRYFGKRYGEK